MTIKAILPYTTGLLMLCGCAHAVQDRASLGGRQDHVGPATAVVHATVQKPSVADLALSEASENPPEEVILTGAELPLVSPPQMVPELTLVQRDEETPEPRLSLEDLEQLALDNNPTLLQAVARVEIALGIRTQVGLYPNPVVGYSGSEIGNEGRGGQQGGFLGQEIVTAGKLRLNRAAATEEVRQAESLLEAQRFRVLNTVRTRYYEVLAAQRAVDLAEELTRVAEEGRNAAEQLFRTGEGAQPDLLQAEIEKDRARILLENAQNRYAAAWKQLTAVLGVPSMMPSPVEGTLDEQVPVLEREEIWQGLLAASPELQVAYANVQRAEYTLERARVEPIPNLLTQATVQSDRSSGFTIVGAQLGIALPVFNRNQGNIRAAEADLMQARAEVRRVELALRDRLAAAFERYQNARQQADKYRERIVPKSQQTLDLVSEGYRAGEFDFLQVLTVQRTFFEANLAYVDSLTNLWRSVATIQGLLLTDGLGPR